jgi:hypothetical protein
MPSQNGHLRLPIGYEQENAEDQPDVAEKQEAPPANVGSTPLIGKDETRQVRERDYQCTRDEKP